MQALAEPALQQRPIVTIDAVLQGDRRSFQNVRWFNAHYLIGVVRDAGANQESAQLISLTGELKEAVGSDQIISVSPNGEAMIRYDAGQWSLCELGPEGKCSAGSILLESGKFSPYLRPAWSPDSRFAAFIENYRPRRSVELEETDRQDGARVIEMEDQSSLLDQWESRVTIVDRTGEQAAAHAPMENSALQLRWSEDNRLFVTTANLFSGEPYTSVVRVDLDVLKPYEIYRTLGRFQTAVPLPHPDREIFALVLDAANRSWSDFQSILLIDAASGRELRRLSDDLPIVGADYVWSRDGREIYARVRGGGLDQVYAFPLDGKPRQLTSGARRHFDIALSPDGRRLSYQTEDGYGRKDIRILDLETGRERVVLVVAEPERKYKLGEWRHIRWKSTDGVRPVGNLFLPPDFDEDQEYPLLVDVHGGGSGSRLYLDAPLTRGVAPGPLEWHAWAALGYVVFTPDYRSTGDYGPEVIAERYERGEIAAIGDLEDILSGTRHVIDLGFVDPSRVAVLGHSAGGQRVYLLLARSDLYAAAILHEPTAPDPVSNFIQLSSGRNVGGYPAALYNKRYGGGLSDVPDRYKRNHMFDSYRNRTPTLIMLGNEILGGVDHMPSEVLYSILREQGTPTRMIKFVEEGHNHSRPASARRAFEEARNWLERHMRPRGN